MSHDKRIRKARAAKRRASAAAVVRTSRAAGAFGLMELVLEGVTVRAVGERLAGVPPSSFLELFADASRALWGELEAIPTEKVRGGQ